MSSISQFINNLYWWIYCSYTLHILFHSETKITLFYLLSSLSFFLISCTTRCHLLLLVVSLGASRCHSLSHLLSLAVTRCHLLYQSLSLVVIRCHLLYHSLSLNVPPRLSFYKRSLRADVFRILLEYYFGEYYSTWLSFFDWLGLVFFVFQINLPD